MFTLTSTKNKNLNTNKNNGFVRLEYFHSLIISEAVYSRGCPVSYQMIPLEEYHLLKGGSRTDRTKVQMKRQRKVQVPQPRTFLG